MAAIDAHFRRDWPGFSLDVDLHLPGRGVTALFGHSGSGKSTLLRCIAGLERAPQGRLAVDSEVWQDAGRWVPTHRRPIGYVFQEASLFAHLSVMGNLRYGMKRVSDAQLVSLDHAIELLGLGHLLDRKPDRLSGGERQRVAIGRALLTQPKLLLMDEPLSALDRGAKAEILPFIEKLRDHFALPIIYISHDLAEVERLADHVVLIDQGRVVGAGPLADVQSDPASPLARSREAAVSLRGVVEAIDATFGLIAVAVAGGRLLAPAPAASVGEARRVHILASAVSLAREKPGRSSILNVLPARVVAMNPLDAVEVVAAVALGEDGEGARLLARMTRKSWEELGLAPGQNVYAQVKSVSLDAGRAEGAKN
ncbi:molybdenum ABC transporter ATP-binding protein [Rhodoblastus sp.]|uniref:molybdenum ABC transporter ATP-binding protein n=1 Tax=Rhodoblastus sp. TaxID=1962975 RepID=UPI002602467B|nr:molybdenum ABC transporter ATP-binding protein [Rhodoblastus sp.]